MGCLPLSLLPQTLLQSTVSSMFALLCPVCRKNHGRQQESLQQSLEEESKAKNEQIRLKKVVEGQIDELQATIDAGEKVIRDGEMKRGGDIVWRGKWWQGGGVREKGEWEVTSNMESRVEIKTDHCSHSRHTHW